MPVNIRAPTGGSHQGRRPTPQRGEQTRNPFIAKDESAPHFPLMAEKFTLGRAVEELDRMY
jgi:hypothetical protein